MSRRGGVYFCLLLTIVFALVPVPHSQAEELSEPVEPTPLPALEEQAPLEAAPAQYIAPVPPPPLLEQPVPPAMAPQAPPGVQPPVGPAGERIVPLALCEVVARALSSNLDIAVERYIPDIRDAELLSVKGEFDPLLRIDYAYSEIELPQSSREGIATGASETETDANVLTGALTGRLISGTEYEIVFDREFSQFIRRGVFVEDPPPGAFVTVEDPWQYVLDTYVRVNQPLLRDFGLNANLAGVRIARAQRDISLQDFRQSVIDIIAEVQRAYWRLVLAIENLRVAETALSLAQDLLRENRIRLQVGTISPLDVVEAETGVAQREEAVIIARSLIKQAEDNLKRLLNLPQNTEEWNVIIVPVDKPVVLEMDFDLSRQIETALENRPDYKSALMQIKSDAINTQFTRNQTLPSVDIIGQYGFSAVDEDIDTALDDIGAGESPSWTAGLSAEYPIGNRVAKGNYRSAQLTQLQSELIAENLRLAIVVQVRDAIRGIETSLKSREASLKTIDFASRSLEAEQKKLEVGISTSYDVLEFVDDLVDAQRREVVARVNYRIALVDLAAATGMILDRSNIFINEQY
jgi:outer membrane protein TolC